jgi:hypothetical protein
MPDMQFPSLNTATLPNMYAASMKKLLEMKLLLYGHLTGYFLAFLFSVVQYPHTLTPACTPLIDTCLSPEQSAAL